MVSQWIGWLIIASILLGLIFLIIYFLKDLAKMAQENSKVTLITFGTLVFIIASLVFGLSINEIVALMLAVGGAISFIIALLGLKREDMRTKNLIVLTLLGVILIALAWAVQ